jgi:RNA polymerase sigma factor (sigma-70 family)
MDVTSAATAEPFEDFYIRMHPRVLGFLIGMVGDLDVARDVADEAFARAVGRWARVGGTTSPEAWVFTVALNVARRRARRRAIERRLLQRSGERRGEQPDSTFELVELLRPLPERQRTAMVLRVFGDLTEQQIADVMGVRRGTVSASLAAAARSLQQVLDRDLAPKGAQP